MKKFISILLALCFVFSLSVSAFAIQNLGAYDDSYVFDYQNYLRNIEKEKAMNQNVSVMREGFVSVSITRYPQIVSYYCGPASAYMVIKSLGFTVPSSTESLYFYKECQTGCNYNYEHQCYKSYTSPQITLANEMGTTINNGTGISSLKNTINSYIRSNYYSICTIPNDSSATTTLTNKIYLTLKDNHPLIAHVDAKKLAHYKGVGQSFGGHYVCIYSINTAAGNIGISDCNYYPGLGGIYTENKDKLKDAIVHYSSNNLIW